MKLPKVTHLAQFSFMLPLCEIRKTQRSYAVSGCRPLIMPVCPGAGATTSQPGIPGAPGPRGAPGNSGYTGDRGRRLSVSVQNPNLSPNPHLSYHFTPPLSRVPLRPSGDPGDCACLGGGTSGSTGSVGSQGSNGRPGYPGEKGEPGDSGSPGFNGIQGPPVSRALIYLAGSVHQVERKSL